MKQIESLHSRTQVLDKICQFAKEPQAPIYLGALLAEVLLEDRLNFDPIPHLDIVTSHGSIEVCTKFVQKLVDDKVFRPELGTSHLDMKVTQK